MEYQFRDVFEFQEKYRTRLEKSEKLMTMSKEEIMHLVNTCPSIQGRIYYASFAKFAKEGENEHESDWRNEAF